MQNFIGSFFRIHVDAFQHDLGADFDRVEVTGASHFGCTGTLFDNIAFFIDQFIPQLLASRKRSVLDDV
ncbi:MAG TPA: hypothetical protein PKD88_11585 [Nitrosomonas sp.]|nr:hypothetical protein [Nitrosomonas sp.]HMW21630.1 hypothetical protein [Nitrosomonas sp.]HMW68186.1 hypothetical protein [Nitrosomonas sp.]HMY62487.1 hypothetical protein [Nitrosomonas sp.]HMY91217.1 hypothetical protein [Nitrosomonas sp.]